MDRRIFNALIIFVLLALTSGCAMVDEHVALQYTPTLKHTRPPATHHRIQLGDIADYRGEDETVLSHKQNPYGVFTAARYLGNMPLRETLRQAVRRGLHQQGYRLRQHGGHLVLSGEVLDYTFDPDNASLKGDIKTQLQINFALNDVKTKAQLWSKTFTVKTVYHDGPFNFKRDTRVLQLEFQQAMNQVMSQLLSTPGFRRVLREKG